VDVLDSQNSFACCDFFIRVGFESNLIDRSFVCVKYKVCAFEQQNSNGRNNQMDDQTPISRGFGFRRREQTPKDRVPPGQYVTTDFPVLSAGPTPQIKVEDWTFALQLGGSLIGKWSWAQFEALPQTTIKTDIHCVTKWSKLDGLARRYD
jgi:DMSO/TMAO reductase YedYZ molybdopterin-dependent catalytic subunit